MKNLCRLFFLSLVLAVIFMGCSHPADSKSSDSNAPERRLLIFVELDEERKFTTIKSDELGGNFSEDINYLGFSSVTIDIDGDTHPLEDAIRDGLITVEEIFAYARIDARNGICGEKYTSKNGLAYFTYSYPEFDIRLTYDVYETPDGKQHLINDLGIYQTGATPYSRYEDENGDRIDMEDWGLEFSVIEATPTSITLQCTQSGGQHIGDLVTTNYEILQKGIWAEPAYVDGVQAPFEYQEDVTIAQNTTSTYTFDWTGIYQPLEKSDYAFYLYIEDQYDESDFHPLMRNFVDRLCFRIDFSID